MLLLVVMWVKRKLTVLSRQSELGVVMRFITDYSCSIFPADRCFLDCNKNGRITTRAAPYYSRAAATHPAVITHTGDPASVANVAPGNHIPALVVLCHTFACCVAPRPSLVLYRQIVYVSHPNHLIKHSLLDFHSFEFCYFPLTRSHTTAAPYFCTAPPNCFLYVSNVKYRRFYP